MIFYHVQFCIEVVRPMALLGIAIAVLIPGLSFAAVLASVHRKPLDVYQSIALMSHLVSVTILMLPPGIVQTHLTSPESVDSARHL